LLFAFIDKRIEVNMELSDLKVFVKVVEHGGITHAATDLNRVPSNVTARIKKLEQELGKLLFIRENNRLRISSTGEQLLPYAKQLLALAQETLDELIDDSPKGKLKIGSMEAVAATRLVEPLMNFHREYPAVELEIITAPTGDLIKLVLAGELDMALVADPKKDERLVITPIFKETLTMVSDLGHKRIKCPQDLQSDTTIMGFSTSCAYRTRLTDWIRQDRDLIKAVEINSYHTLLSCVAAGMGVGIVPLALLDNYPFANSLQVHALPTKWQHSVTSFIWRKDSVKTSVEAFTKCVHGNV
jgi:DNA-binding transcriptional LysR family regulator